MTESSPVGSERESVQYWLAKSKQNQPGRPPAVPSLTVDPWSLPLCDLEVVLTPMLAFNLPSNSPSYLRIENWIAPLSGPDKYIRSKGIDKYNAQQSLTQASLTSVLYPPVWSLRHLFFMWSLWKTREERYCL